MEIKKGYIEVFSPRLVTFLGNIVHGSGSETRVASLFPFIFIKDKNNPEWLIRHELIHFKQQTETLLVGLMIMKWIESLYCLLFSKKNKQERYIFHACEQEAYRNHNDKEYLQKRKFFGMFKYIKNKKTFSINKITGEINYE